MEGGSSIKMIEYPTCNVYFHLPCQIVKTTYYEKNHGRTVALHQ